MTEQLGAFYGAGPTTLGGARLKERGMALVETAEAIHGAWVKECDYWIEVMADSGREFSAENVRDLVGDPAHPNAMGARFNAAARRGLIVRAGYTTATRADRHASMLALWRGK